MLKNNIFFNQAELMLRILPFVAKETCFALKGGTAINFFIRDMPRISVDIDLTYLPIESRETSLNQINDALKRIEIALKKTLKNIQVVEKIVGNRITKIFVKNNVGVQVTIEPNEVIRGTVFPAKIMDVSKKIQETFQMSAEIQVLSVPDLYGGKICAALDRQHPRDLFDVKILFENEGITNDIRRSFVVYLAGHDRPINEMLNPTFKDIKGVFDKEFFGMTDSIVTHEELVETRKQCLSVIKEQLTKEERLFLLSVKEAKPQWELLGIKNIENFPSIQWKLLNIKKMSADKHKINVEKLKKVLNL